MPEHEGQDSVHQEAAQEGQQEQQDIKREVTLHITNRAIENLKEGIEEQLKRLDFRGKHGDDEAFAQAGRDMKELGDILNQLNRIK